MAAPRSSSNPDPAGSFGPKRSPPMPARDPDPETDPVVEAYKRDIDRTLLRQNLRRSVTERVANLSAL